MTSHHRRKWGCFIHLYSVIYLTYHSVIVPIVLFEITIKWHSETLNKAKASGVISHEKWFSTRDHFFFKVKLHKLLKACDRNMLCSWRVALFQPCRCYGDCSFTLKSLFGGRTSFTLWQSFSYLVAGLMYLSVLLHTPLKLPMVNLSCISPEGRTLWILSWDGSKIS